MRGCQACEVQAQSSSVRYIRITLRFSNRKATLLQSEVSWVSFGSFTEKPEDYSHTYQKKMPNPCKSLTCLHNRLLRTQENWQSLCNFLMWNPELCEDKIRVEGLIWDFVYQVETLQHYIIKHSSHNAQWTNTNFITFLCQSHIQYTQTNGSFMKN